MNVFTAAVEKAVKKATGQGSAARLRVTKAAEKREQNRFVPDATRARNRAQKAADQRRVRKISRFNSASKRREAMMARLSESQAALFASTNPAHAQMRANVYRSLVNQITAESLPALRDENPQSSIHELRVTARQLAIAKLADAGITEA